MASLKEMPEEVMWLPPPKTIFQFLGQVFQFKSEMLSSIVELTVPCGISPPNITQLAFCEI